MNIVTVNLENLSDKERKQFLSIIEKANMSSGIPLSEIEVGATFKVGDIEFIKFSDVDGVTTAVTKKTIFNSKYGNNNSFAESEILKRLTNEFYPKIVGVVGEENLCEITTDSTSLDGLCAYGEVKSYVSLPTFDFYRANVELFDKYKLDEWWWLATPYSVKPHYDPDWACCVSPSGVVSSSGYYYGNGVRPFCRFVSSIFVSSGD